MVQKEDKTANPRRAAYASLRRTAAPAMINTAQQLSEPILAEGKQPHIWIPKTLLKMKRQSTHTKKQHKSSSTPSGEIDDAWGDM